MEHGRVTDVYYSDGRVHCNVKSMTHSGTDYTEIPVVKTHAGFTKLPKEGQVVVMDKLDRRTRFITGVIATEKATQDSLREGELALQLDENTKLVFSKNGNNHDIEISASGELSIEADGEIRMDAPDGIYLNGIDMTEHEHYYNWTDGAGTSYTNGPSPKQ